MEIETWGKYGAKVPTYWGGNSPVMITAPAVK